MARPNERERDFIPYQGHWDLRLYVIDELPRCVNAVGAVRRMCEAYLRGNYTLEVIDLKLHPRAARDAQILAVPTLVRANPGPAMKFIGDMSRTDRLLEGMGLQPQGDA